jgi:hypothetical protein
VSKKQGTVDFYKKKRDELAPEVIRLHRTGMAMHAIAEAFGAQGHPMSQGTVRRILTENNAYTPKRDPGIYRNRKVRTNGRWSHLK